MGNLLQFPDTPEQLKEKIIRSLRDVAEQQSTDEERSKAHDKIDEYLDEYHPED